MIIFPAIDLMEGCAVRLLHGDYNQKTVYSPDPLSVARDFEKCGATAIHMVDLEGARYGSTSNIETVSEIARKTNLFVEIGGGIRNEETIRKYLSAGVARVILGTAAVKDETFLKKAVETYGDKIAVSADARDGKIAVRGWLEDTQLTLDAFFMKMQSVGVSTVICTDISKDGAMQGTNRGLYQSLSEKYSVNITASGGVSSLDDVIALRRQNLYGAIIGKAYYTGAIDLKKTIEVAK